MKRELIESIEMLEKSVSFYKEVELAASLQSFMFTYSVIGMIGQNEEINCEVLRAINEAKENKALAQKRVVHEINTLLLYKRELAQW